MPYQTSPLDISWSEPKVGPEISTPLNHLSMFPASTSSNPVFEFLKLYIQLLIYILIRMCFKLRYSYKACSDASMPIPLSFHPP